MSALEAHENFNDVIYPLYLKASNTSGLKKVCKEVQKELLLHWTFQRILWAERVMSNKFEQIEKCLEK
jgi:hypothetical protein